MSVSGTVGKMMGNVLVLLWWRACPAFPGKPWFPSTCRAAPTENPGIKSGWHWCSCLNLTKRVTAMKKEHGNVVQQEHQQQKSLCKSCLSRHTEFNYSKDLIRMFLLFHCFFHLFFFSLSFFHLTDRFVVALMFSLYAAPQTAPCPGDDKYF